MEDGTLVLLVIWFGSVWEDWERIRIEIIVSNGCLQWDEGGGEGLLVRMGLNGRCAANFAHLPLHIPRWSSTDFALNSSPIHTLPGGSKGKNGTAYVGSAGLV